MKFIMNTLKIALRLASMLLLVAASEGVFAADGQGPLFEGKDTLLRPVGYREWIFVGSSLGLQYEQKNLKDPSEKLDYKNVYINPEAYREFVKTGKFPQGTILGLEIFAAANKKEPGLGGSFQDEFVGLLAAVKDRTRFGDDWAYFRFTATPGKLKDKAQPFAKSDCYDCHRQHGATDNVFTQFYPLLRSSVPKPVR